jgi:hypothetical protein
VGDWLVSREHGFIGTTTDAFTRGFADAECDRLAVANPQFNGDSERYAA